MTSHKEITVAKPHLIAPIFTEQQISRFWSKVAKGEPNDCWLWTACVGVRGYGKFTLRFAENPRRPASFNAHVLARYFTTGEWPSGLCTLHACDNPPCCNPAHLWLGTNADNSADMLSKDRHRTADRRGEAGGRAKLSEAQVIRIRRLHDAGGITYVELGRQFGVHPVSIRLIVKRINWSHIP